jgi:hypothetical protein
MEMTRNALMSYDDDEASRGQTSVRMQRSASSTRKNPPSVEREVVKHAADEQVFLQMAMAMAAVMASMLSSDFDVVSRNAKVTCLCFKMVTRKQTHRYLQLLTFLVCFTLISTTIGSSIRLPSSGTG